MPSPRAARRQLPVGCLIAIALVFVVGLPTCVYVANRTDSHASLWSYERQKLAGYARDLSVAEAAGNVTHAAQLRESIIKACQTDSVLKPDNSDDHARVQSACVGMGIAVP